MGVFFRFRTPSRPMCSKRPSSSPRRTAGCSTAGTSPPESSSVRTEQGRERSPSAPSGRWTRFLCATRRPWAGSTPPVPKAGNSLHVLQVCMGLVRMCPSLANHALTGRWWTRSRFRQILKPETMSCLSDGTVRPPHKFGTAAQTSRLFRWLVSFLLGSLNL